ncbi:MAG: dTDP-4-dehydrorhamnose 3,5-epimerase family protein [bacterium]|nr:dTDP-4-dehydrorhamnose 3,5-epimerase family protein [bacterium]
MELITLENKDNSNLIKDVLMHPLKVNRDESGILVETLRTDWKEIYGQDRKFSMQYYSKTASNIARDEDVWHIHPNYQEDRFLVVEGEIVVAVADQREVSSTKGSINIFRMKAEEPYILLIPKDTLHGFLVVSPEPAILINFPTGLYSPEEEGRVPYAQAQVKMPDGTLFSWDLVRKELNLSL